MSVLITAAAAGQGLPAGITMHRMQAGVLDADGWTAAASSSGNFSVKLPCLFNDFSSQEQDPVAPALKGHTVGCLRSNQSKFSATRAEYKQGKRAAEEIFATLQSGKGWEIAKVMPSTYKGFKTVTIEDANNGRCGFLRYVLVDTDVIALIVEAPRSACADLRESVERFFSSLEVALPDKTMESTR